MESHERKLSQEASRTCPRPSFQCAITPRQVVGSDPCEEGELTATMTTFTMHYIKGHFVVSGPDISPMRFKSRPEARGWCNTDHPGLPITEVDRDASRRIAAVPKGLPRNALKQGRIEGQNG
jgi:hypothetical protein